LAVAGVVVAGLTGAAFRFVGPLYGQQVGLAVDQIAWFLAAFVLGGALAQWPAGWLADRFDRRVVLIWLSAIAIAASFVTVGAADQGTAAVMLAAGLFGFVTFPVYSVAAAHAHDFAQADERVELSAALLFFYALGAIASPLVASALIERYGSGALFLFIATGHAALVGYGLMRMRARPTRAERTSYVYAPRTSFLLGRLTKRLREGTRSD
jgi:MFS family permease